MRTFALYDLDRTVLRHASFTPFLLFAARRAAPSRLLLAPVWLAAMAGHKAGLYRRGALKQFGLRLFLGSRMTERDLQDLGEAFAQKVAPAWVAPGAAKTIETDRRAGRDLVLVTAAMQFYAAPIARRLGFAQVLATHHRPLDRPGRCFVAGENCYGDEKVERVRAMLAEAGIAREACRIIFYSDSTSDAPLLAFADEGVLVNGSRSGRRRASREGWRAVSFRG